MSTIKVGTVNGIAITAFQKGDEYLVPIKPICTALGIDVEAQRKKIMESKHLAPVAVLETAVGADNCPREMHCLPLFYIPGWLFSINPNNVAPNVRERVGEFQWECYKVLYHHFFSDLIESTTMGERAREIKKEITYLQESINANQEEAKQLKGKMKELESQLEDVTAKMITPEKHLFNT